MKITIVSGSTREGRKSHRVALALEKSLTALDHHVEILDLKVLALEPFVERLQFLSEKPHNLVKISETLQHSDGIIFLTPEYNGSISSAMKNFIDTFGRAEYARKPIGVATASTGMMGGMRAAAQLQQIILAIQGYPLPQMLLSGEVDKNLDEEGNIINPAYETKLSNFVEAYLTFVGKLGA